MIRYRLIHKTQYRYETPATRARHFMHLLPRARDGQAVHHAALDVGPIPSSRADETDYFGNPTTTIEIDAPHETLDVTVAAEIGLAPPKPPETAGMAWAAMANDLRLPPEITEFRAPTRLTGTDEAVQAFTEAHFTPGADLMTALTGLMHDLFAGFRYRPGSTTIATTGARALARREGVCQDYAHAMLACLRGRGLPARYVSGYLRSSPTGGGAQHRGAEQTHAWVSAWLGPVHGWVDFDPTNDMLVTTDHVTLAWGRDYDDVSPIRGVILGGGKHTPHVSVRLEPS